MASHAHSTVVPFPSPASPAGGTPYCFLRPDDDCPPGVVRFPAPPEPARLLSKSVEIVLLTALFGSDNALLREVESTLWKMSRGVPDDRYIAEAHEFAQRLAFGEPQ